MDMHLEADMHRHSTQTAKHALTRADTLTHTCTHMHLHLHMQMGLRVERGDG
jgi:hypothetical protein